MGGRKNSTPGMRFNAWGLPWEAVLHLLAVPRVTSLETFTYCC